MAQDIDVIEDGVPDDGRTIDNDADDQRANAATRIELLPPSKLPPGQQWSVLSTWVKADMEHSREWRGEAKFWYQFRAGEQWTVDDKALLDTKGRPHIVFNRVLTILKAVAGMEINGRHEIHFAPRNVEDAKVNEVLSQASKWMADECDGEDEESQAFDDCCTCGMGWCENRMNYEDDPTGLYVEEAIFPLEMYWDRAAMKKNLSNARRLERVRRMPVAEAMSMFSGFTRDQIDATWAVDGELDWPQKSLEQKWKRDEPNTLDPAYNDLAEVTVVQIQWFERETYWLVADEATNSKAELSEQQYRVFEQRMKLLGMNPVAAKLTRKVYKQAFLGAEGVMLRPAGPAPIAGQFSWKCVTGEIDKIKGTFFGLVKVMRDPQMWANKWVSQILHILNTTAKGGILAERSAFDDEREAEESYAQADEITWVEDGSLSGAQKPKIMPKPGDAKIEGYLGLLTFAISSIKDTVGINLELLGQQDINQPGILEAMRKQAGMTVLATLFDSLRRFRKQTGRARLYFIQNFLSDGRLIRVTGPDGANAVRLAKDKTTGIYDVIVDDTPTSPNQKEANWAIIQPMLAAFKDQLVAQPEILLILLEYSPLPTRVVDAIKQFFMQQKADPQQQQEKEENRKLLVAGAVAKINKDQSTAEMQNAKAQTSQATAVYDIAFAKNMLEDNMRQGNFDQIRAHLDTLESVAKAGESQARGRKASAEADHIQAKATRERVGAHADLIDAMSGHSVNAAEAERTAAEGDRAAAESHREQVGAFVDGIVGHAQATRHHAAAEQHRAAARREDRTPVAPPGGAGGA